MHFLEWHTRGDFFTADEHCGKLQCIQHPVAFLTPIGASYFIVNLRSSTFAKIREAPFRALSIICQFPFVSFLALLELVNIV